MLLDMRIRALLLSAVLPFIGACAGDSGEGPSAGDDRGGLGKADIVGKCVTPEGELLCDGPGTGNCWCDAECVENNDCCEDAADACGIEVPEPEGTICGGLLGSICADDEYCAYQPGDACGTADAAATCQSIPEVCITLFDPVCGCDGETYSNSCAAAAAGTGVSAVGECDADAPPSFCGGIAGIQCPEGEVCVANPDSTCDPELGGADCGGLCVPEPAECEPVLCELYCEYGFAENDDGCAVCSCAPPPGQFCGGIGSIPCPEGQVCVANPDSACDPELGGADCGGLCIVEEPECQPVLCELFCENGFATGEDGCAVCSCAPPANCEPVLCELFCENGFATGEDGCEVCSCA